MVLYLNTWTSEEEKELLNNFDDLFDPDDLLLPQADGTFEEQENQNLDTFDGFNIQGGKLPTL